MADDALRASCFASLDVLCATHGEDVLYRGGLDAGFAFRGGRVPFLSPQKGIFRAAAQEDAAALSINTSSNGPYRAGPVDQPDNRALRAAYARAVPLVYFISTRPNYHKPVYPVYVMADDPGSQRVLVSPGRMVGPLDERDPILLDDPLERQYAVREARVRLHQARFRGRVLVAYSSRCTICRLKETRLLDAAHIVGDLEARGEPVVSNGLSLCSIHHRAFDQDLVGVSPDYTVHVSRRLLDDEDGPMLEVLKAFHARPIELPSRRTWQPDRARLAERFETLSRGWLTRRPAPARG
jgi:putative restriction endonuclease